MSTLKLTLEQWRNFGRPDLGSKIYLKNKETKKIMSQEKIEILEQKVSELSSVLSSILSVLSKIQSDANDNFTTLETKIDELRGHTSNEFKDVKLELKKIQNFCYRGSDFENYEIYGIELSTKNKL